MIHFELFYHLVRRSQFNPLNNICFVKAAEKYILGIHPKKIIILAPFHSKTFVLLYKFKKSWALLGRLNSGFFAISGASNLKHFKQLFMTLSGLGLLSMWELPRRVSYFVSSLLYNYFSCFIDLPLRFLPPKPSFLHDHYFTTQQSDFSIFLAVCTTDKPVNRSIHPYALT